MTRNEWLEVARRINANWPHQAVPQAALAKWYDDLRDLPAEQVLASVEALYREGREFPPNGGQVRRKAAELSIDAPTFGMAWRKVLAAIRRFGYTSESEAVAWLDAQHPLIADLARQMGWRQLCMSHEPDVLHGQARRVFAALEERAKRDSTLRGLDAAGLRALDRLNREPAQIGLVLQALPAGSKEAPDVQ